MTDNNDISEKNPGRRKLLQTMGAAGGVAMVFPTRWNKPTIDAALLPAHASTSGCLECSQPTGFEIILNWNVPTTNPANLDLYVDTPGGTRVGPGPEETLVGQCVQHLGDASTSLSGNEIIASIVDFSRPVGTFRVFVRNTTPGSPANFNVETGFCGDDPSATEPSGVINGDQVIDLGTVGISSGGTVTYNLSID